MTSGTYTIQSAAATPTFSPGAGSYSSPRSVTISDSSAGTNIYYTTNGTTPTTSSAIYTGPITVSATTTLNAIAVGNGFSPSAVASAVYNIQSAGFPTAIQKTSGLVEFSSSMTVSLPSGVTAHDLLLACVMTWADTTIGISDNDANTWTLIAQKSNTGGATTSYCWYAANANAGPTTITISSSASTAIYTVSEEVAGLVTSSPLDATGTATSTSGNGSVTTGTSVKESSEYIVAFFADWNNEGIWTAGSGYTAESQVDDTSGGASCVLEDRSATALTGTVTVTASKSISSDYWVGILATFKTH